MPSTTAKLTSAVEAYFAGIRQIKSAGGGTDEKSLYGPLSNLLDAVGATLQPKVFCVQELADHGVGHPDFGLYTTQQVQKGKPKSGQKPERGVIEAKGVGDDVQQIAQSPQVRQYLEGYQQVLVTNYRDFILVGRDSEGKPIQLESFTTASSAAEFDNKLARPRAFANEVGAGLGEYLTRVMSQSAALVEPRDVAWLLASYARDGLARAEKAGDASSFESLREALEESLGVHFEGEEGTAFFRSTLIQTLFYGIFSAWVLRARQTPTPTEPFDWRTSGWYLRTPVMQALFQQLAGPAQLEPLGLVEVLDWAGAALNRVERDAFLAKFHEGEAVPYFYEPFLQAFDPDLRSQLGVWYTPPEIVRYMVARVDQALKDDLEIADGLADENVYVLDPCCGTGAFLAEVLRRISTNLQDKGLDGLVGSQVKQAAIKRVFGFEIMPAPLVVAHLQVSLAMQELDASFSENGSERPGIYLTNALTGWEPTVQKELPFAELERERERAEHVKQDTPVLVILGNPPYNGFAGVAIDEEKDMLEPYRHAQQVEIKDTRGLNDLYARFFRMAERRIAEKTGKGVVCFISNYSWLDGLSFAGMRERLLNAFDVVRIDNLHGDRKISEYAPDGRTSETVFAMSGQSAGIRVGISIAMLSKTSSAAPQAPTVMYRDFDQAKAAERRQALLYNADLHDIDAGYMQIHPDVRLGLPIKLLAASDEWHDWPSLPDLLPISFPGVHTGRDRFLVDIDSANLRARVADYFDYTMSHDEIARLYPSAVRNSTAFKVSNGRTVRQALLERGGPKESGFVRDSYRPFDNRWLYWEDDRRLLTAPSPDYWPHVFDGNVWLSAAKHLRRGGSVPQACVAKSVGSFHLIERGAAMFPAWLRENGLEAAGTEIRQRPNLSPQAERYIDNLGLDVEDLFHYILAILHDPAYLAANAGALRMGWPRIPLPGWPDGRADEAAEELAASAARGRLLAALLDSDTPVAGVTTGRLRSELAGIAVPTALDGANMAGDDFNVSAGWGYLGQSDAVMPGQGRTEPRAYTGEEQSALGHATATLGDATLDVFLNDRACWRNVPAAVWNYQLGGYQVLKKWLSYRERKVLGRNLKPDEIWHFTNTARRIAAILLLTHGS